MQSREEIWQDENLINSLKEGRVAVMPTDTIYGIVGKAQNENTVKKIYETRKRSPEKPCIILIGDIDDLNFFSINLSEVQKEKLKEYWSFEKSQDFQPGPVSIVLDCPDEKFSYLHRGTHTLAFRMPLSESLRNLILKTGPLVAPSANLEGLPPSENIQDAKNYFGDKVDLYMNAGPIRAKASKLLSLNADGSITILRE